MKHATAILRGVRGFGDFENEARYATYNKMLSAGAGSDGSGGIETIFIPANPLYLHVSSSAVREMSSYIYGNNLSDAPLGNMVTLKVQAALQKCNSTTTPYGDQIG